MEGSVEGIREKQGPGKTKQREYEVMIITFKYVQSYFVEKRP